MKNEKIKRIIWIILPSPFNFYIFNLCFWSLVFDFWFIYCQSWYSCSNSWVFASL